MFLVYTDLRENRLTVFKHESSGMNTLRHAKVSSSPCPMQPDIVILLLVYVKFGVRNMAHLNSPKQLSSCFMRIACIGVFSLCLFSAVASSNRSKIQANSRFSVVPVNFDAGSGS